MNGREEMAAKAAEVCEFVGLDFLIGQLTVATFFLLKCVVVDRQWSMIRKG
jgi:hypothetical protein